jgi:Ca2+-binding EF-hand superfamily protein
MISSISGTGNLNRSSFAQMRQQMFNRIDTDSDGKISKDELTQMVANGPTGGPSADELLKQSDTDGDGYVSQSEFEAVVNKGPQAQNQGGLNVDDAFSALDANGDGTISKSEFDGFFTQTTDSAQGSDS